MEDKDRCKALAHSFTASACTLYEKDGYLMPVLILMDDDGDGIILSPHPDLSPHPAEGAAMMLMLLGRAVRTRHFAFICESWVREQKHNPGDPEPVLPRGTLERESETDPNVKTSLLIQVYSVKDWDASFSVMMTLDTFTTADGRVGLGLEPNELPGFPQGYVPDILKRAYLQSPPVEIPDLAEMCEKLVEKQLCATASVLIG